MISEKHLNSMSNPPKIKTGQKVNLVQVTGKSTIHGYVLIPITFQTTQGPVEITVEAWDECTFHFRK